MKKIGIVTFYDAINYGAFLQCFALQKVLEKKYDVSIIKYSNKKIKKDYALIKTSSIKKFLKSLIFLIKNIKKHKRFKKAIKEYMILSSKDNYYDIVIAGSDQIWNIELTGGVDRIFTLNYFNNVKKISYASSIGKEHLIDDNMDIYKKIVDGIDFVSVREESARDILQSISNKKIYVNIDPTLLIEKNEWKKYITKEQETDNYIFSYFVAVTQDNYNALYYLSKKIGMKVISYSENPKEKNILKKCYSDGPFDFITRLKNSRIVFTSSFHGVVFSIIFNKQFICMLPKEKASRITNLLEKLDLSDRVVKTLEGLKNFDYNKKIDYLKVNKKLEKLRNESIKWLFDSIEV